MSLWPLFRYEAHDNTIRLHAPDCRGDHDSRTVVLAGKMTIDACLMNEGPGYFRGNAYMIRMFILSLIFIAYIQAHSFFVTGYLTFIHATECLPYAKRNACFDCGCRLQICGKTMME